MAEPFDAGADRRQQGKELYRRLRNLTCEQLWADEVARFDRATPRERIARVAVVRAVGTVFGAAGDPQQKDMGRRWLRGLLADPTEKVRRYAASALAAVGAGPEEEAALLALRRVSASERERKVLEQALAKIGGSSTLARLRGGAGQQTERKLRARLARVASPGGVSIEATLDEFADLRVHLHSRRGFESIVAAEVEEHTRRGGKFRVRAVGRGFVAVSSSARFSLADLHAFRCFDTLGFVLGSVRATEGADRVDALASLLTSARARRILGALTRGAIRYRIEFAGTGHQRAAIRRLADRCYERWPDLLNDPSRAPWTVAIRPAGRAEVVELVPQVRPDPRLYYRLDDIPAASHPTLAASLARLAGPLRDEVVWDPFCGSGMELVECALLGSVRRVHGSDVDPAAVRIARRNFAAAGRAVPAMFTVGDFRDFAAQGIAARSLSLVITNPPMGRRVPTPNVHRTIADLMDVAATVLRPGGRLVLPNPVRTVTPPPALRLRSRQTVDFGGFECRLEVYENASS